MTQPLLPPSGARESNAGDDFLTLWAARRAVEMLNPASDLKCVRVEGLSPVDVATLDPTKSYFLAVDLVEYFGGTTFEKAHRVVISQLKYSTRNPHEAWTWGKLRKKKDQGESVIRRLAQSYEDLFKRGANSGQTHQQLRAQVLGKVVIRLVSNQCADSKVTATLQMARAALETKFAQSSVSFADLLKHLQTVAGWKATHTTALEKLCEGSGLKDEFTDFLRILDLSGCGEVSRLKQKAALLREVGESVSFNAMNGLRRVCDLLREEAQPERERSAGVTQANLLAALEVFSYDNLFPCPPQLEATHRFVATSDAPSLVRTLRQSSTRRLLAHGEAGVGKTTTMQQLPKHLPKGSVALIYDCYGGGTYHDLDAQRHTYDRAIMQMSNELAAKCGLPFLVEVAGNAADALRDFKRRLVAASKIVGQSGGSLVIVIDAADNALTAARTKGHDCFVPHLWSLWNDLPQNCFLVMSARTHRQSSLQSPDGTPRYELTGFDAAASAQYLRQVFPGASDRSCSEFHLRTSHNPRVQSYLMDRAQMMGAGRAAWFYTLRHARLTPEEIFDDLIRAAVQDVSEPLRAEQHLATLTCLMRPIPLTVFAGACGISAAQALNFCRALRPGVVIEEEAITFRDEDFETHLRRRVGDLTARHASLGAHFLALAATDDYAAQAVAGHLFAGEREIELIQLALDGPQPDIITDDLLRLRVVRRRLELALKSVSQMGRDADAVKLLLRSAEVARTNTAVVELVQHDPELATIYGNPRSVVELCAQKEHASWFGPAHMQIAALYARDPQRLDLAREHYEYAEAWLRRYFRLPENERRHWDFSSVDMARRWEAIFYLDGLEPLQNDVKRWHPKEIVLDALDALVRTVAPRLGTEKCDEILQGLHLTLRAQCVVLAALWEVGHLPPRECVEATMERIERALNLKRVARKSNENSSRYPHRHSREDWPLSLCEMGAFHRLDSVRTLRMLEELGPQPLDRVPHNVLDFGEHLPALRAACLKAALEDRDLGAEELLPERYRQKHDEEGKPIHDSHDSERRTFKNTIGLILPIQKLWAQALISTLPVDEVTEAVRDGLKSLKSIQWETEGRGGPRMEIFALTSCETLLLCEGDAQALLQEIADTLPDLAQELSPHIWLVMAARLARHHSYRNFAARLAERAADVVNQTPMPSKERWELLLRCAQIVAPFENELGRDFYRRALEAAEGIDDDAAPLLSFAARTASGLAPAMQTVSKASEGRALALRLAALVEAYKPYVSDTSLLPFSQTLDAACRLEPGVGLSLALRWDDSGLFEIEEGIRPVVTALGESGFWPVDEAIWLHGLEGNEVNVSESAIQCLESLYNQGSAQRPKLLWLLDEFSFWVERDTPRFRRSKAMERLVHWAQTHALANRPSIERLQRTVAFARSLSNVKDDDERHYGAESRQNAQVWLQEARLGDLDLFLEKRETIRDLRGKYLADYLITLGENIPFGRRVEFLEAITTLQVEWYEGRDHPVLGALCDLLDKWKRNNVVSGWAREGIPRWLETSLSTLWGHFDQPFNERAENLETLWDLPLLPSSRASLLIPAILNRLDHLNAQSLCLVAANLAMHLSPTEKQAVLQDVLARLQLGLERDDKSLPFTNLGALSQEELSPDKALASFAWVLLGHPDKRVRWRVLHALRHILRAPSGAPMLLTELIQLSQSTGVGPLDFGGEFFWMSARSYALVLFERLAHERPLDLAPHLPVLAQHALSKEFPHAQIRELAKRACLQVLRNAPNALASGTVEQLERINVPFACLYPRENTYYRRSRSGEKEKDFHSARFYFDSVDTVPYWFDPLSGKFGHQGPDVSDSAERWICDVWGRTKDDCQRDRGTARRYNYKYTETGHGSIPTVETLRTSLIYHAMMCAAGELIDAYPVSVDTYDDPQDPWEDWLEYHLPFFDDCWEADLRGPTPLRPDCWAVLPMGEKYPQKWSAKRLEDYEDALGTQEPGRENWIVVWGHTTHGESEHRMTFDVQSALVGTKNSRALLRALQCTDPMNLALPVVNRHHDKWDFDEGDFYLQPFLQDEQHRDRALDEKDGAARGVFPSFTLLSDKVLDALDLRLVDGQRNWLNRSGEVVAQLEIWSDDIHDQDHISGHYSHGQRLWLRRDVLQEFLAEQNCSLIVEVVHNRYHERNNFSENETKIDLGKHVIFLFHPNGNCQTLAGDCPLGTENRP